jgi:RNA methyltransferase, TrmH family
VGRRSARSDEGCFVVEGSKLLAEAVAAGAVVDEVFVAAGTAAPEGFRVSQLEPGVIEKVADTVTPQPVLAVVRSVDVPLDAVAEAEWVVVAADVRDPGNAGTLLRSAEAAGAGAVLFCDGSVDVYNPKTVRASAGSLFHVPVVSSGDPVEVLEQVSRWGMARLGTVAAGGTDCTVADLASRRVALVFGNEAWGLAPALESLVDEHLTIPMVGRTESLNVGMAASVLCFEVARQRRAA